VVRFAALRLAAAVVAVVILGAAYAGAASLPWDPLQGLAHSCPYGSSFYDCHYPARPAWVVPSAVGIALVGLFAASTVLAATRRRPPAFLLEKPPSASGSR